MSENPKPAGEAARDSAIPERLFFRIGEVSQLLGVEPYVIRYWESEFKALAPKKSSSGHRMFRKKDVEALLEIKELLYDRKFTIEGARKALAERSAHRRSMENTRARQGELFFQAGPLDQIRRELIEILKLIPVPK